MDRLQSFKMSRKKQKKQEVVQNTKAAMLDHLLPLLPPENVQALLNELAQPLYPSFRFNPLKGADSKTVKNWTERYQWQLKPVPFCDTGFWVTDSPYSISKTIEHSLGHYYIQDAASMLPVELFDFTRSEHPLILDMEASPGGKTTHLVSKTNDQALIIANDTSRERLTALRLIMQNWGSSHVAVTNYPGEYFGSWYPETFDCILLDAPCSMQGLRESDSHSIKSITQKEINNLAKRQMKLLESALKSLKINGQVVYSTCTLTLEENEMVLDAIMHKYGHQVQIDPIEYILQKPAPALGQFDQHRFHSQVPHAARIWPFSFGTAGFFAARITKIISIDVIQKRPPARPLSETEWNPVTDQLLQELTKKLSDLYGISLKRLIDDHNWEIWQYKNNLHCFPAEFFHHFAELPVQALGLPLGELTQSEFQLSHEFVSRFGGLADKNIYVLDPDSLITWMRGEDIPSAPAIGTNLQIIRDQQGRNIGRGKPSAGRLRNMLPKRALLQDF